MQANSESDQDEEREEMENPGETPVGVQLQEQIIQSQNQEMDTEIEEAIPPSGSNAGNARMSLQPVPAIRKGAGRRAGRVWEFVDGDRKQTHVYLKCCQGTKITANATMIKKHFRTCNRFQRKFPAAVALFDPSIAQLEANTDKNSDQAIMQPTGPLETILPNSQYSKQSTIGDYYKTITPAMAEKFDRLYTNALLHDAMPFNALSSALWKEFWHAIFNGAWTPPGRNVITSKWLPQAKEKSDDDVSKSMRLMPFLSASADGWSDVNGRPVIHLLMGGVIPFVVQALNMGAQRESSVNLDNVLSKGMREALLYFMGNTDKLLIAFVSDSPSVMVLARKYLSGEVEGGSNMACFGIGCACHGLSLLIKDSFRYSKAAKILKLGTKVAHYFKNVHLAGQQLEEERRKVVPRSVTIKTFSKTRWGGAAYMFRSLLSNKSQMGAVFTNDRMRPSSKKLLDVQTNENAKLAEETTGDGDFWGGLEALTPFVELQLAVTTFLEGDLAPISGVVVGYAYIYRASDSLRDKGFSTLPSFIKRQVKKRLKLIWSPVHALAVVLDPAITPEEWKLFDGLLGRGKLADGARQALSRLSSFFNYNQERQSHAMSALNARLAHQLPLERNEMSYHPVVWWKQEGSVMADVLSPYGMAVFSVFPSSAGPERSFKSRSRVVTTVRNRMSKNNADMQSGLIFNGAQAKRFLVDFVMTKPRDSKLWDIMLGRSTQVQQEAAVDVGTPSAPRGNNQESSHGGSSGVNPTRASDGSIVFATEEDVLASFLPDYEEPTVDECILTQLGGGERLEDNLDLAWGELHGSDQESDDELPLF